MTAGTPRTTTAGHQEQSSSPAASDPRIAGLATTVLSQTAVLTAMLYYFGWARSNAFFDYFGLDVTIAGFTAADYVLRSVSPVFLPLVAAVALLLLGEYLDRSLIRPRVQRCPRSKRNTYRIVLSYLRRICFALQIGIIGSALLQLPIDWPYNVLFPLGLAAASATQLYTNRLTAKYPRIRPRQSIDQLRKGESPRRHVLIATLLVGVFWALGLYAAAAGESAAEDSASGISERPSLVIFTTQRLSISGPGVTAAPIVQSDVKFRYVYRGMRLLLKTSNKYIILPTGWRKGIDSATLLPDDDSVRVDVIAAS